MVSEMVKILIINIIRANQLTEDNWKPILHCSVFLVVMKSSALFVKI